MDITVVIAIIAGPILAVEAQRWVAKVTHRKQAKEAIFKTLMSTRGTRLSQNHVQALNMIDLEFYGRQKKNKKVIDAWRLYLDQLVDCPRDTQAPDYKTKLDVWNVKSVDVFNDMLFEMATALGYHFDKVLLKRGTYTPTAHGETEFDQFLIRRGLAEVFLGSKSIPIHIVESPDVQETKPSQETSQQEKPNVKH